MSVAVLKEPRKPRKEGKKEWHQRIPALHVIREGETPPKPLQPQVQVVKKTLTIDPNAVYSLTFRKGVVKQGRQTFIGNHPDFGDTYIVADKGWAESVTISTTEPMRCCLFATGKCIIAKAAPPLTEEYIFGQIDNGLREREAEVTKREAEAAQMCAHWEEQFRLLEKRRQDLDELEEKLNEKVCRREKLVKAHDLLLDAVEDLEDKAKAGGVQIFTSSIHEVLTQAFSAVS